MTNGKLRTKAQKRSKASATILVMVFSAIFTMVLIGLVRLTAEEYKAVNAKQAGQIAGDLAESGLEYYEWFLSRFPGDYQDGTGAPGPYTHQIKDISNGQTLGSFTLSINPKRECGALQSLQIDSVGVSAKDGRFTRHLRGILARPSVARFSYIIDTDVWAGASRQIIGPYHSNGGIRMDGTNNSLVTSAKNTWACDSSFGCSPTQSKPGVFGAGPNSNLWNYPVDEKSFVSFAANFSELKNLARNHGGIYLHRFTGNYGNDRKGYELVFRDDGTVDVYRVTNSSATWGYRREYGYNYSGSFGWRRERNHIMHRHFQGRYTVPSACSVIFSQEKLWIKGTVKGKLTVVAARPSGPYQPEVVLEGNLRYADSDGSDGITIIAQSYILIPEYSPNNMELNGIFVSQNGSFGRSFYNGNTRSHLTINGTVVSKDRVGTSWGCGSSGYFCSGYAHRVNSYDRFLRNDPPPFTPALSDKYIYVKWSEEN